MKGHWHLIVISTVVAILTTSMGGNIVVSVFLLWLYWLYRKRRIKKLPLLMSVSAFILFALFFITTTGSDTSNLTPSPNQISGKVVSQVTDTISKVEFVLEEKNPPQKTLVTLFKNSNKTIQHLDNLKNGSICTVDGNRDLPPSSTNPGQFDYRNYLSLQGITSQVILSNREDISCSGSSMKSIIHDLRNSLLTHLDNAYSPFTSNWISALLLGDDSGISEQTTELFQHWNLSHLLAISGLHVGLIVTLLYFCMVKLGILTKEKAQSMIIVLLPLYAILAGEAPSVWRSCLMTMLFFLLVKIKFKLNVTDVLSIIFIVLIVMDKHIIHHLGFQFSFLVTFGLLLSKAILIRPHSKTFLLLNISFLSQMLLLPLQLANFYFFNPLAVFINLFIVPYFTLFVIPTVFILVIASFLIPPFLSILDTSFSWIHQVVLHGLQLIDNWIYFPWVLGEFPYLMYIIYFLVFCLFMGQLIVQNLWKAFQYGCFLCLVLITISVQPYLNPVGTVTMLDVGQGDTFIIELPYRKGVIMIDAAGSMYQDFETTSDKVYNQMIKPYLYSRGITTIDHLFLSHNDVDHIGSVAYLLEEFSVEKIIVNEYFDFSKNSLELLQKNGVSIGKVQIGDQVSVSGQPFLVLHPDRDHRSTNENSTVLYTQIGGLRWLFTGDISKQMEEKILLTYPNLEVDVLKVSHHGSDTSTSEKMLTYTTPQVAWIAVGKNNRYGHPGNQVIERLEKRGILIMRTDLSGAVQYKFSATDGTFMKFLP